MQSAMLRKRTVLREFVMIRGCPVHGVGGASAITCGLNAPSEWYIYIRGSEKSGWWTTLPRHGRVGTSYFVKAMLIFEF